MSFAANIDEKVDGLFSSIDRTPRRPSSAPSTAPRVPRPPRPVEPGKIDISNAPSSMEEMAKRWGGR